MLHVKSITTAARVDKMKDVFARFGFPDEIVFDNGPQYFRRQNSDRLLRAPGLLTQRQPSSYLTQMGKLREQYKRPNE